MNTANLDKLLRAISLLHGYQIQGQLKFEQYFNLVNPDETPQPPDRKRPKQAKDFQGFRARAATPPTLHKDRDKSSSSLPTNSKAEAVPHNIRKSTSSPRMVMGEAEKGAIIVYCRYRGISGTNEGDFKDFEKVMGRFSPHRRPLGSFKTAMRKLTINTPKLERDKFRSAFEASPNFKHFQEFLRVEQEEENASEVYEEDTHAEESDGREVDE